MNLTVKLQREQSPPDAEDTNPWQTDIDVQFLDGAVNFERFAYPLSGLTGRMRIVNGNFEIDEIRASGETVTVAVSGSARRTPGQLNASPAADTRDEARVRFPVECDAAVIRG